MPIDSQHKLYKDFKPLWNKCRITALGEDAVKASDSFTEQIFLPKLDGQTLEVEYTTYRDRASFYNAVGRTVQVLKGLVFSKEPTVEAPEGMAEFLLKVTASGEPLETFARALFDEILTSTRCGILVDFPTVPAEAQPLTIAQAESMKLRPYFSLYNSNSIINWKTATRNNEEVLEWVVLEEVREIAKPDDPYENEDQKVYRKLSIETGVYVQEVYAKGKDGTFAVIEGPFIPQMNGKTLDFIPFIVCNGSDLSVAAINKPVLLDLVNLNISHYRTSADYEHAMHYTALPTAYITGLRDDGKGGEMYIGSAAAWKLPKESTCGFLEFQGHGLQPMADSMASKESRMAKLGARLLAEDKKGVEAAETAATNRAGESASLADLASLVSRMLTKALTIARDWLKFAGDVSARLNNDYMPMRLDPQALVALLQTMQGGGMSFETFYHNLKRGGLTIPNREVEEERAAIDVESPDLDTEVRNLGDQGDKKTEEQAE